MKLCGLFLVLLPALAIAQGDSSAKAKKIIDDAVTALGGDKFLNMEDRIESGRAYSFYRENLSGLSIATIYTRYLTVADGKTGEELGVRERQAFGKNEDSGYVLFREDGGWEVTFRGAREVAKDRLDRYRDTTFRNIFYILRIRLREPGLSFDYKGFDVVENQPVEIVNIVDSQNREVTVYFHQTTKLPVRQVFYWRDPQTKDRNEEVTRFARYQETSGIQWPHQITRERNGERIYQIFSESVSINRDLTDSVFAVPNGPATKPNVKKK
ncbi:MAG: hypothetical protein JO307_08820 [Bryobacterales bacterium]|nr:hypothetical protein [Bryobacterales bacterium]MBV9397434.1 hypothetical protein [Bryobacterales bacterium]